jgi:hypothetical protein
LPNVVPSASHLGVPRKLPTTRPPYVPEDEAVAASSVVELVRQGEEVLALIDPAARGRDLIEFHAWLSARLTIGELQRLLLPRCDDRCATLDHRPDEFVVLADIAVDEAQARPQSWWESWNDALEHEHQAKRMWFAGSPALLATDPTRRLVAGTELTRVAVTDPYWVHYDHLGQETLYRIESGPHHGERLIAVTFGHSPLLPGFAGALIVPDHPPVRDRIVAVRFLAAGWAAVERGLPHEE